MKVLCTQENLNRGLNIISRVVANPKTLPVLNNILLSCEKGQLKMSATNLEIGINITVGAKIEKEGSITVPARVFSDFIANIRDKNISLEKEEMNIKVESENFSAKIAGADPGEFPVIPIIEKGDRIKLPAKKIEESVAKIVIACAIDESRPVLSGVYFNFTDDKLKLVSTDSYRLAEITLGFEKKAKFNNFIIPSKTIQEIARIISLKDFKKDSDIELLIAENQVQFLLDSDTEVTSRLIEGSFPNYEQIIPSEPTTEALVDKEAFLAGIKSTNPFSQTSANNVRLVVGKDQVELFASATQIGDSRAKVKADIKGGKLEIAFNARFIMDVLNVLSGDKIYLGLTEKLAPAIISDPKQKDYIYIIMPLRGEEE